MRARTGRHRRRASHAPPPRSTRSTRTTRIPRSTRTVHPSHTRLAAAFPALLGPGRRAAWRRYCLRRTAATVLALTGCALVFLAGATQATLTG
ncbi:MAG: hypothetical protein Q4G67_15945 [Actinomycetia bacterium]|nr:hypothetical protein [Actinomycetes bacterium]